MNSIDRLVFNIRFMDRGRLLLGGGVAAAATIVTAVILLATLLPLGPASASVTLETPDKVSQGSDFVAKVNIADVADMDSAIYTVAYDPAVLEIVDVTGGAIAESEIKIVTWKPVSGQSPGAVSITSAVPGLESASGSGHLAQIHFRAVNPSAGSTTVLFGDESVMLKLGAAEITGVEWKGTSVTVEGSPPPTPTPTPTSTPEPAPTPLYTPTPTPGWPSGGGGGGGGGGGLPTPTPTPNITPTITPTPTPVPVEVGIDAPSDVSEGSDFLARVSIGEVIHLSNGLLYVDYDPSAIELTNVTSGLIGGTSIPIDIWGLVPPATHGTARALVRIPGLDGASGSGYLCQLQFHVVGSSGETSPITPYDIELTNAVAVPIPTAASGGSVHIVE